MFGGCSGFDCAIVSAELFSGFVTLAVSLTVAAFSVWWAHKYQEDRAKKDRQLEGQRRRRFQRKLLDLGVARGAAIDIRNEGGKEPLTGDNLTEWLNSARSAERTVIDTAGRVARATGTLVNWFDTVDAPPYLHITHPEQRQMVINLSGVAKKAEQILLIGFTQK